MSRSRGDGGRYGVGVRRPPAVPPVLLAAMLLGARLGLAGCSPSVTGYLALAVDPAGRLVAVVAVCDGKHLGRLTLTDVTAGTAAYKAPDGAVIGLDWINIGFALSGVSGPPQLQGSGKIASGERAKIVLLDAAPSSLAMLFVSLSADPQPFKGGTLVPAAPAFHLAIVTDSTGGIELSISGSAGLPAGLDLVMQYAIVDASALQGVALSNALQTSTH